MVREKNTRMFITAQWLIAKSWKQPNIQQYGDCFSKLCPYAVIQNKSLEVYLWPALLVPMPNILFPFLCQQISEIVQGSSIHCSRHKIMTMLSPLSQLPLHLGMYLWSSSGQLHIKRKSSGDFWEHFCFSNKKNRYSWCLQSPTSDLLLSETDSYLLSKGQ